MQDGKDDGVPAMTPASSTASGGRPQGAARELPDDLRIPLHELQADAGYLVGRVAADGSTSGMILQVLETKLSHIAEAAYRLNGSRDDLLEALKELADAEKDITDYENGDIEDDREGWDVRGAYGRIEKARLSARAALKSAGA